MPEQPWWKDAVVYQIYPRSFQDSDGDGLGDLNGIRRRLDHVAELGADAIWLSPFYASPGADLGYDVSDHCAVDPRLGTVEDFERLAARAHELGLRVLCDLIPSHTSIEHPWFRARPDLYTWSEQGPPNNWLAAFGGSAWSRDQLSRRWYLHSFYPEQPDLDWRNPEVAEEFARIVRFWLDRGADGFRVDAIDRALKDEQLRDEPILGPDDPPFGLPISEHLTGLGRIRSGSDPGIGSTVLAALREAAGDALLVGEVYLPHSELTRFLEQLDLAFAFELFHSRWNADSLRAAIDSAPSRSAWVLSNHDFSRTATRFGRRAARAAAVLLLSLPGPAFVYQGEEIGMADGPGADPPVDRAGRDAARHPMRWDGSTGGGFSSASKTWLPPDPQPGVSVAEQLGREHSMLELYRDMIAARAELDGELEWIDAPAGVLAFRRGRHAIVVNTSDEPRPWPRAAAPGRIVVASERAADPDSVAAHTGVLLCPA